MKNIKNSERKPLSFSTTMRNPDRIVKFLNCIVPFEGMNLTNQIIENVAVDLIIKKLYRTEKYEMKVPRYKEIYKNDNKTFTKEQAIDIIKKSPQEHKEKGFEKGWPSRFDTWYKLSMELGFIYYKMNEPIKISQAGHMLIDAYNETPVNFQKIENVMLNSMMKYQSNNPFRRNLNDNAPLLLLLNVLKKLKNDKEENGAGLFKQEIPLLICWPNNDFELLYKKIKEIRKEVGYNYSNEYIYNICLNLLEVGEEKKNRFKMSQICGESVDEYIRKMRSTGIISLRGNGRFIDLNKFEINKINYIIDNYSKYEKYNDEIDYYNYVGNIDNNILNIVNNCSDTTEIKEQTLNKFAKNYTKEQIFEELIKVCNKKESKDVVFKYISSPTRLEFLTSIALKQNFDNLLVKPNYSIDDEGLPTYTASGGVADIECYDTKCDSFFEVTLMRGRQEQLNNEILPIRRHLIEHIKTNHNDVNFSAFIAPVIHEDTVEMAKWYKYKDNIDILTLNINDFICKMKTSKTVLDFFNNSITTI